MEVLDQEKFNSVKELAALGTQVAETAALLRKLKTETEEYLQERGVLADERVKKVLESSKELLTEADKYHETFKIFLNSTGDIASSIRDMVSSLSALREETQRYTEEVDRNFREKTSSIAQQTQTLRFAWETLNKEQEYVNSQKEIIRNDRLKLDDERRTLERAYERLKQGKI